jgi:hypothetical protein
MLEKECCSGTEQGLPSIHRTKLSKKYLNISDEDFDTVSCFLVVKKYDG